MTTLHSIRRLLLWTLIIAWAGAFLASHVPLPRFPPQMPGDKALHVAGFFVLTSLFLLALASHRLGLDRRLPLTVCAMMLYGALDEITQPLARRTRDLHDWYADVVGVLLAVAVWETLLFILQRTRRGTAGGA